MLSTARASLHTDASWNTPDHVLLFMLLSVGYL